MKKKLLACTLAALLCLQPVSAVLAENMEPGDVAQTTEEFSISSHSDLSDTAGSDTGSSSAEDSSAGSDFSASDTSETISDADSDDNSADSDISEENSVQELTEDFSDDAEDTEILSQEESADEASAQELEFDDGSVPSAGADSNTFGDFQYTTSGLTATITKYTGTAASVTVPSRIDNYTVTKIASSAFADNLSLTSVVISDTITEIGFNAFEGCAALKTLKLPSQLKTLGYGFISGTLVTTLTIPAGLTKCYSYNAYSYGPLHGAENLTELILADGMEKIPDYLALFSTSETTHLSSVSIPDSVTSIGSHSFANCTALGKINLPDSVTSIGSCTFSGCKKLSSIRWSENLQTIDGSAFTDCSAIEVLAFPKSVKTIEAYAFKGCSSVSSLSFSDNPKGGFLTDINHNAFENCTALENISFSQNINSLGYSAFSGCSSLEKVILSDSVTTIDNSAFSGCSALESIKLPSKLKTLGYSFISGTLVTTLTIPAGLTKCYSYNAYSYGPLHGAENLTELILADGMEKIPDYLAWFSTSETTHLTSVSIPDSVTSIGSYSFANCTALGEISIPDSVTSIANGAFSGCSGLSSVRWSENLQSIGSNSFANCTALETLSFPKSVKTIDSYAFKGCSSVSSLSFSDNPKGGFLTDIKYSAFENCTALENISFSKNINSLGYSAFSGCSSLENVILSDSITTIDNAAFSGCSALESIKLPSKLKTLGYGFISGTLVTTLTIPAGLTKCYSYNSATSYGPLHGAENLTELILADGMEKIPDYLAWFSASETTHLTSVSIPDSATSIGYSSFANCTALGEITIPDSVTSIANTAFSGWKNLVIKSAAGSAAHAYAKANNIPFQEVIQEGKRIIAGRLDAVNAEDGTINIEGRDYPVSGNFSLTGAMSILQNSSDKIVIFNYDNSRVTHMEAAEDIIELQMQAVTDVNNSNTFVYENGQYQKNSLSQNMVLKCKVSPNSSYSYDEIRQLLPGYTISVTGIELLASAPLNAYFREALTLSKMEFSTPVKVKVTDSKTIATAVFGISSDYIAEKANSDFSVSFLARYGNSDSYVLSGGKHIYLANHDYQRQQTEKKKSQTERGQKLASAQQILGKNNSILTIDPKLNDYFTQPQMEEFYDFLSCYMAVAINSTSFSYTGDQKNKSCQQVLEKLFEKMGITKQSFIVGKTLKGHFAISASTKKGDRTINFTYSVSAYGFSDVTFSSLGTLNYSISQDNCSGIIGLAGADTKSFAEQVKQLAEASVKNVYNEAWGNYANEVADLLFTKTVQDLIRNSRYGSFSNLVYTMLTKPSQTAAAQNRRKTNTSIKCPVDVYVYDSSHNLCGSIINNVVDTSYNDIIMSVENDEKFISFCGDDYYLKLVGNDNGTMTYEVEEYNGDTLSRKITYNDIPLTAGKTYNAYIPEGQDMDTGVYSPINESGEKSQAASDTRKTAPQPVSVESIQLDQTQKALLAGESFKLTPSIKPANASTKDVLWISDKESVATVDSNGTVKAVSPGTAIITAQTFDGAFTASCTVTVTSPEISVDTLTVTVPDVDCNGAAQFPPVTVRSGSTLLTLDKDYTLTYSDNIKPGTATVTLTGLGTYTGKRNITFQILEKAHNWSSWKITKAPTVLKTGQKQRTCSYCGTTETASVSRLKATYKLSMSSVVLKKGQTTAAFKVTGLAKGDKVKSYRSANKKIASIDSRGRIKGLKVGNTKITVMLLSGKKIYVKVKVQKNAVATRKLTVSPARVSLKVKKTCTLKISRAPLTTVEKVTYRSSNSKIASVNSKGVITARKKGTATITVLSGKKKATVKVTVK